MVFKGEKVGAIFLYLVKMIGQSRKSKRNGDTTLLFGGSKWTFEVRNFLTNLNFLFTKRVIFHGINLMGLDRPRFAGAIDRLLMIVV